MHLDTVLTSDKFPNKSGTLKEAVEISRKVKETSTKQEAKKRANKVLKLAYNNGLRALRTHCDIDPTAGLDFLEVLLDLKERWQDKIDFQVVSFPQEGLSPSILELMEESLKMGVDLMGGIPNHKEKPRKHIKKLFDLATKYDVDIDMHIDERDDPTSLTIKDLAKETIERNYQGRVTADHCCSLAANKVEDLDEVFRLAREAELNVVSLPSTNLCLQGRNDQIAPRRGITRVKALLDNNIPVMLGSDNIRDSFNPFGNADMLEEALIAAHGCYMGNQKDLEKIFKMITIIPSNKLDFKNEIKIGNKADFIVLDQTDTAQAIVEQSDIFASFRKNKYQLK